MQDVDENPNLPTNYAQTKQLHARVCWVGWGRWCVWFRKKFVTVKNCRWESRFLSSVSLPIF